jgi:hypothetical protein
MPTAVGCFLTEADFDFESALSSLLLLAGGGGGTTRGRIVGPGLALCESSWSLSGSTSDSSDDSLKSSTLMARSRCGCWGRLLLSRRDDAAEGGAAWASWRKERTDSHPRDFDRCLDLDTARERDLDDLFKTSEDVLLLRLRPLDPISQTE